MVLSKVLGVWGSASSAGKAEVWEWDRNQARRKWDFVLLGLWKANPCTPPRAVAGSRTGACL